MEIAFRSIIILAVICCMQSVTDASSVGRIVAIQSIEQFREAVSVSKSDKDIGSSMIASRIGVLVGFSTYSTLVRSWKERVAEMFAIEAAEGASEVAAADTDLIECTNIDDLRSLGVQDFTVVYLSKQGRLNEESVLLQVQSCLDAHARLAVCNKGDAPIKLAFIVEGKEDHGLRSVKRAVESMMQSFQLRFGSTAVIEVHRPFP
jgi:hypothetical protein